MALDLSPATNDIGPLFRHTSFLPLLHLLQPHLPHGLPVYSTLATPGFEPSVWASFPPGKEDVRSFSPTEKPWFALADLGNQLRFFCSEEVDKDLTAEQKEKAEDLVVRSLRWYVREHPEGRTDIRIGGFAGIWTSCIERAFGQPFYPCNIHYQHLLADQPSTSTSLPDGISVKETEEKHIDQILSTSDVPHLPSYILTRLPHASSLFHSPTSSTSTPSSSTSSDQSPSAQPELVAHCITHRDGSIGTVHVSPAFRQRGLGALVMQERMRTMSAFHCPEELDRYAYCYVSPDNEKSRALMRRIGMKKTEWYVYWAVVQVPLVGP
ncbi:hypothetical protein JCM11251_007526 [Rhodosporidiobolus azoricus]